MYTLAYKPTTLWMALYQHPLDILSRVGWSFFFWVGWRSSFLRQFPLGRQNSLRLSIAVTQTTSRWPRFCLVWDFQNYPIRLRSRRVRMTLTIINDVGSSSRPMWKCKIPVPKWITKPPWETSVSRSDTKMNGKRSASTAADGWASACCYCKDIRPTEKQIEEEEQERPEEGWWWSICDSIQPEARTHAILSQNGSTDKTQTKSKEITRARTPRRRADLEEIK